MAVHNSKNSKFSPEEFDKLNTEEKIMSMAEALATPPGKPKHEVLDAILNQIEPSTPTRIFPLKRFLQTVAALVIVFLSVYSYQNLFLLEKATTQMAELSEIKLPDGTNVTLNAASKLSWDDRKFEKKRRVNLSGEAYFDVKKGDNFVIYTKNGTVEILGTKLNIFSRDNSFRVSCISGKVRVTANNQMQIVTPGQLVKLNEGNLIKIDSDNIEKTISWKNGLFHFEDTELNTIFKEMERQFNVSIQFKGNDKRKATIDFSNENLNEALDIVCIPMELSYEIQKNNKIIVSEKK